MRRHEAPCSRQTALAFGLLLSLACSRAPQPAATPPAAENTDIGVPECDQYLRKQHACFDIKLAPDALAAANETLDATRVKWRAMKTDPRTSASLAMTCALATRDATAAMQDLGCAW